jgi:hypothetical protein
MFAKTPHVTLKKLFPLVVVAHSAATRKPEHILQEFSSFEITTRTIRATIL